MTNLNTIKKTYRWEIEKKLSKKTIWWLQDVCWGFEHIFVFFQLMQQVVLKPHSRKLNATKITMKSEKGHYQTTCLMILIPQLKHLAEYVLTGKTGIFISRCLPAGVLGKPRPATPLSLESNPTVSFFICRFQLALSLLSFLDDSNLYSKSLL